MLFIFAIAFDEEKMSKSKYLFFQSQKEGACGYVKDVQLGTKLVFPAVITNVMYDLTL